MKINKLFVLASLFLFACCSNPEKDFRQALQKVVASPMKVITDAQFQNLSKMLDECKTPVQVGTFSVSDSSTLAEYFIANGITGTAKALQQLPDNVAPFSQLNILLETSASMKGYSNGGNPEFSKPIIALLGSVDKNKTKIVTKYAYGDDKDSVYIKTVNEQNFKESLSQGRVPDEKSSPLQDILQMIVDHSSDSTATILITDGIISGTNEQIVKNREYTLDMLPSLENDIKGTMSEAKENGQQFEIFCFEVPFTGYYYDYRNNDGKKSKHNYKSVDRPFYMIFIGPENHLCDMQTKLSSDSDFNPLHSISSFGVLPEVSFGVLTPSSMSGHSTKVKMSANHLQFPKKAITEPFFVNYHIVFPAGMPERFVNDQYIKDHINLKYQDPSSQVDVDVTGEMLVEVKPAQSPNAFDVTLQFTDSFVNSVASRRELKLSIPAEREDWYVNMSIDNDDVYPGDNTHKTFKLENFVDAFFRGYGMSDSMENIVEQTIIIGK